MDAPDVPDQRHRGRKLPKQEEKMRSAERDMAMAVAETEGLRKELAYLRRKVNSLLDAASKHQN